MLFGVLISLFLGITPAFAHVVVKPNQVGVAAFQTFTIGVPNEKDNPIIALRLLIPDGLKSVSPNVKPGWKIDTKITEIDWTGGSIPVGMRDDFYFSAQVPADRTTLNWKAYQTYQNGTIVSWDQAPVQNMSDDDREKLEKQNLGPYSQTEVINDLMTSASPKDGITINYGDNKLAVALAGLALLLSVISLGLQFKDSKRK